ncbi:hypothetical protein BUALT_Bualt19G0104900 [Buddleja alternifolia]|uniref:Uncharacterized protein n=1 Tax=Buddleja alternifolia TaxID=168488 RepID=A0AAV6W238_9LAMI|nr:hypothetical protein BUALT_Bualt19G0104900 [Buddleja alternifolia]
MARTAIKNTKMLLRKPLISMQGLEIGRCMSRFAKPNHHKNADNILEGPVADEQRQPEDPQSCWMPHPRTGIYFPKGQEWVMEDIPNDAASFDCTFWLRNIDGVDDKPDPDNFTHHYRN